MRLIASMNTRDELGRYLTATVAALLEFVDEVRVQDDGSTDGTAEYLEGLDRVEVHRNEHGTRWTENEGKLHQQLLEWTLAGEPTHILAIDADELVLDGLRVRAALLEDELYARDSYAWTLCMTELWGLHPPVVRMDGGWRPHEVGVLYRAPTGRDRYRADWQIWGRKMAGGRVPRIIRRMQRNGRAKPLGADIAHLGWANPAERERRYQRYVELDGGNYHARAHLESITWPDERCRLEPYTYGDRVLELLGESP